MTGLAAVSLLSRSAYIYIYVHVYSRMKKYTIASLQTLIETCATIKMTIYGYTNNHSILCSF